MTTPTAAADAAARDRTRASGADLRAALLSSADALRRLPQAATVKEVARAAYEAAMLAARGNSGVILSQLLRGFSAALAETEVLTPDLLVAALEQASQAGYEAVS